MSAQRWWVVGLVLSACTALAPAQTPPQLDNTPGPPVVVTWNTYAAPEFSTFYPAGWTVITSPATSQRWVVFISPDEQAVMVLALNRDDTQVTPPVQGDSAPRRAERTVVLSGGQTLHAALIAPPENWDSLWQLFERMVN